MSTIGINNLFSVEGAVAVVTGGGTGMYIYKAIRFMFEFNINSEQVSAV